jgi:hypothetical protein
MSSDHVFEEIGNRWDVEPSGIRIHGTKSAAAVREVPRVGFLVSPATKQLVFSRHLQRTSGAR